MFLFGGEILNTIDFKFYLNYTDYDSIRNRRLAPLQNYQTTKVDLIRCAYTVGLSANLIKLLPIELKRHRGAIIDAYLNFTTSKIQFKERNFKFLEQSEKTSLMYSFGMIFAQSYMQRHYKIRHLMHLKSSCVSHYPQGRTPDLWGVDLSTRKSYLVEAKGTSEPGYFFDKGIIKDAIDQLNSIDLIEFHAGTRSRNFWGNELEKIAIGSHPNKVWEVTQQIIDPTEGENIRIKIYGEDLIKEYYNNILKTIESYSKEIYYINGLEIIGVYVSELEVKIGILKVLYDILMGERNEENIYDQVNDILDDYLEGFLETSNNYMGLDGIYIETYN